MRTAAPLQASHPRRLCASHGALGSYLDALHPHLWRSGRQFPATPAAIRQMVADGELMIALAFNPNEAANEVAAKRQAETVYAWQMAGGAIGNTHFLAIPFNANAKEGAGVHQFFCCRPKPRHARRTSASGRPDRAGAGQAARQ